MQLFPAKSRTGRLANSKFCQKPRLKAQERPAARVTSPKSQQIRAARAAQIANPELLRDKICRESRKLQELRPKWRSGTLFCRLFSSMPFPFQLFRQYFELLLKVLEFRDSAGSFCSIIRSQCTYPPLLIHQEPCNYR